jgi:hypothetical protein
MLSETKLMKIYKESQYYSTNDTSTNQCNNLIIQSVSSIYRIHRHYN